MTDRPATPEPAHAARAGTAASETGRGAPAFDGSARFGDGDAR